MNIVFPLLTADQIEVKVAQVSEKGASLLLYKTARTDMELLDEVIGAMNWECRYEEIKGNLYCSIGVFNQEQGRVIWKTDCGIESREDDAGNQKKGEASDAFKRAGFRWGIGRELYTGPFVFAHLPTNRRPNGKGYELLNRFARFDVKHIAYDENRRICALEIVDNNGSVVFSYPKGSKANTGSNQQPAPANQQTPAPPEQTAPPQDSCRFITQEQIADIQIRCDAQKIRMLCEKYGIADLTDMSEMTAFDVINKLKRREQGGNAQ